MVDYFEAESGQILVIKNDDIAFDTDRPSINLFEDSTKITYSGGIDFPDLFSTTIYLNRSTGGTTYCESYSALIRQEWGPNEVDLNETTATGSVPTTRNLPRTLLGSVPADTDYLDVRANLSRTIIPPPFFTMYPPVVLFKEGAEIDLKGGSCPCEVFQPLIRHFDIVRVGNDIYLERFQSVNWKGNFTHVNAAMSHPWISPGTQSGWSNWFRGNGEWSTIRSDGAQLAVRLDSKGPDLSGNKRPPWLTTPGTNPCACPGYGTVAANFRSFYSGTVTDAGQGGRPDA